MLISNLYAGRSDFMDGPQQPLGCHRLNCLMKKNMYIFMYKRKQDAMQKAKLFPGGIATNDKE